MIICIKQNTFTPNDHAYATEANSVDSCGNNGMITQVKYPSITGSGMQLGWSERQDVHYYMYKILSQWIHYWYYVKPPV
jgi:hypothetical protein